MAGGIAPRSARSWAVRTLMELTMATAVIVEPGPIGVSTPSMSTSASACGVHRSMTRSASSSSRLPDDRIGFARRRLGDRRDRDDAQPARRAPRAISTGTAVSAAGREDDQDVLRLEV